MSIKNIAASVKPAMRHERAKGGSANVSDFQKAFLAARKGYMDGIAPDVFMYKGTMYSVRQAGENALPRPEGRVGIPTPPERPQDLTPTSIAAPTEDIPSAPQPQPNNWGASSGFGGDKDVSPAMSQPAPAIKGDLLTKAMEHYNYLRSIGATHNEAVMLTSAGAAESSFNPNAVHDNGNGYGLYGHNLGRVDMRGMDWQQQAAAGLQDLRSRPEDKLVNSTNDPTQLTIAQMHYERPRGYSPNSPESGDNWAGRLGYTRQFFGMDDHTPSAQTPHNAPGVVTSSFQVQPNASDADLAAMDQDIKNRQEQAHPTNTFQMQPNATDADIAGMEKDIQERQQGKGAQSIMDTQGFADGGETGNDRLQNAKDMNFHDRVFYHATHENFPEFNLQPWAEATGEKAHFFIDKPQVADSYLGGQYIRADSPDAQKIGTAPMDNGVGRIYAEGSNVIPVRIRDLEKFHIWDFNGAAYNPNEMKSILKQAKKAKKPGVVITNIKDPGMLMYGPLGSANVRANLVAVFDSHAHHIRSVNANFDPNEKNSRNLLAAKGGKITPSALVEKALSRFGAQMPASMPPNIGIMAGRRR